MALKKSGQSDQWIVGSVVALTILLKAGAHLQPLKPVIDGLNKYIGADNIIETLLVAALFYLLFEKSTEVRQNIAYDPQPLPYSNAEPTPEGASQTASSQIEANSKIGVTPKFEFHGSNPATVAHSDVSPRRHRHNLQFVGASKLLTDFEREVSSADEGFRAVKACFLNQPSDEEPVGDFNDALARVTYRDNSGAIFARIDWPKWLNRDSNSRHIHIDGNTSACMLLAVFGNDRNWAVPFIEEREQGYWDRGKVPMIEGRTLPVGELTVEIVIVGEDNVSLAPANVRLRLGEDGEAQIL